MADGLTSIRGFLSLRELDRDDGRYVYEIEMRSGYMEYECDINAVTGVIIDWDADWDD